MTPEQTEEFGEVKASLEHIKTDLSEIKSDNKAFQHSFSEMVSVQVQNGVMLNQQQKDIESLQSKTDKLEKIIYRGLGALSTITTLAFTVIELLPMFHK